MSMIGDNHVYSFSQLSSFDECPYGYYLAKIERAEQKENAFAQYGTLMHSIIERWSNGEIETEKMVDVWKDEYAATVTENWPKFLASKGYAAKAYEAGVEYLENFDCFDGYEILATEQKFETDISGRRFVGIMDMLLKDKSTGEIVILDHKSKSLSAFKSSADHMYMQTLLYAKYVKEFYGVFPDKMRFNLFKERMYQERAFSIEDYDKAIDWATKIMEKIESYDFIDWLETQGTPFFCTNLCGVREHCPKGTEKNHKKKTR